MSQSAAPLDALYRRLAGVDSSPSGARRASAELPILSGGSGFRRRSGYPYGMNGGTIPPQDDAPVAAAADEAEIRLPNDPRIPQPDDADPTVSKELGGAAPAIGPGARRGGR